MDEKKFSGGVRSLWADHYDQELGSYILSPIDQLSCDTCPFDNGRKGSVRRHSIFKKLEGLKKGICRKLWMKVLNSIEAAYTGNDEQNHSLIVDCVIYLRDALGSRGR